MQESSQVMKLRIKGNPLATLINIVEALHPVQLDDPRLGYINMPELVENAREHLDYIATDLNKRSTRRRPYIP